MLQKHYLHYNNTATLFVADSININENKNKNTQSESVFLIDIRMLFSQYFIYLGITYQTLN